MTDEDRALRPEDQDRDVLEEVDRLIVALQSHPDAMVREQVSSLLAGIDAVHRAGLTHLVNAIHGMAGDALINKLIADPAIRLLLMSYGLLAVDRRLQAEEALDAVRGHLHGHGIDVEILEVVGGVVYVRLHGLEKHTLSVESATHDVEEALEAGFSGFQELVVRDRIHSAPQTHLIPLGGLRRPHRPVYRCVIGTSELPVGHMKAVDVNGQPLLIANVAGEYYVVRNRCGDSPLPLQFGELDGPELTCSWHGCRYDLRSGKRLDRDGDRLQVFPVEVEDGEIKVAIDVEPLPAERP